MGGLKKLRVIGTTACTAAAGGGGGGVCAAAGYSGMGVDERGGRGVLELLQVHTIPAILMIAVGESGSCRRCDVVVFDTLAMQSDLNRLFHHVGV